MKRNIERLSHFGLFSSPTPDDNGYKEFVKHYENKLKNNASLKKDLEVKKREASSIWYTQTNNGINLLQDKELRYFLTEFNSRAWNYGLASLPSSFRVLEGFFQWNSNLFYFELLEEEEHLFSIYDFFDFVTSNKCSNSIDYFINNIENDIIYNYNIIDDIKNITFSTSDDKKYVIGGVSFVKRFDEVFMLVIAGEIGDLNEIGNKLPDFKHEGDFKSYIKPSGDRKKEAVKLLDNEDIWKVNLYLRIDLSKKTIDKKYIQKDTGIGFSTITDDCSLFFSNIDEIKKLEDFMKIQIEEISKYDAIFEAAYSCLYLPEYFDFHDNQILLEKHPTNLFDEIPKRKFFKNEINYNLKFFFKTKAVWILDVLIENTNKNTSLLQSELRIEKEGYWKEIDRDKKGIDKNGNVIHGKTWVEKTLSWYESPLNKKEVELNFSKLITANKGYIYLLRNPAHDLDIFKIGLTTKTVEERAKQLSGTPSPDKFLIINRWEVKDCLIAEKLIHNKLENYRINTKREFFKIKFEDAINEIIPIIEKINK